MIDQSRYNLYCYSDNRIIAYDKKEKRNISYPRLIMEDYLQRELEPNEEVHHIDGNTLNNDISNLQVLTTEEHHRLHGELSKLLSKYSDKTMTCPTCNKTFIWTAAQQKSFMSNKRVSEKQGKIKCGPFCSNECAGLYTSSIQYQTELHTEPLKPINKNCPVCGKTFTWSIASQRSYKKGEINLPEPCCSLECMHALRKTTEEYKIFADIIYKTMKETKGSVLKTAKILGIGKSTVLTRLKGMGYPYHKKDYI